MQYDIFLTDLMVWRTVYARLKQTVDMLEKHVKTTVESLNLHRPYDVHRGFMKKSACRC